MTEGKSGILRKGGKGLKTVVYGTWEVDQLYLGETPVWPESVVLIETAEDLVAFAQRVYEGETALNARLMQDISMDGVTLPRRIGTTSSGGYQGIFDGNKKTVSGLTAGLFKYLIAGSVVKDLRLSGTVSEGYGILTDYLEGGEIRNCETFGEVSTLNYSAGIAGFVREGSRIYRCRNYAYIRSAANRAAGIAAYAASGEVLLEECCNFGSVITTGSGNTLGGIIGYCTSKTHILNCYNGGSVFVEDDTMTGNLIGGISGYATTSVAENCYSYGSCSNALFGMNGKNADNCYYLDTLTQDYYGTALSEELLRSKAAVALLGSAYQLPASEDINRGFPILKWEA